MTPAMTRLFRLLLLFLLPALLLPMSGRGGTDDAERGRILIISSYNPDTRRMSSFTTEFEQQILRSGVPYDIFIENLECKGISDAPVWIGHMDRILERYEQHNLKAVILLGQEAWASFISLGRFPQGVAFFGCFASSNGVTLPHADTVCFPRWNPASADLMRVADSTGMGGGMLNRYDVPRNIELITSIFPEVRNIAFVSDNTYGGISLQALVRKEMEKFPELNLVLIDSRHEEDEIRQTMAALPRTTAVLLGTWRVGSDGQYLMQSSLQELVRLNPHLPVFSLTGTGIGTVAVGGYVPVYDNGAAQIARQIASSYFDGTGKAHIHLTDGEYRFDAKKLRESKIPEYNLPEGSVIEDTTAAKLVKYSHYIDILVALLAALAVLLGFVVLLLLISLRSEPITSKVIYAVEDYALCGQTGLQAGDEIVAVNGRHCFVANDMLYELMRIESYRAAFTVRRDGKLVELPDVQFDTWQDAQGQTHMTLGFTVYGLKKTPKNVLKEAANSVIYYGRIIYTSLADLLRGRESINDLSGPVGIVTAIGQAASYGWEDVFELLALITINLGVLNLLPFPALDGGKIVFLLIEAVTGHAVPEKIQGSLTVAAFALLFGLMLFATYNDIVRLVTGAV